MTRKQALHIALEVITDKDVIDKIHEILNDMPFTHWTEKAIFDAIDQFIIDNGRIPAAADFKKKGLPPHPVIKLHFGINLKEFLEKYYPGNKKCDSKIYYTKTKEEWKDYFINQYYTIKPTGAEEYNSKRTENTPAWGTISNLYEIRRWSDWLKFCDITPYFSERFYSRTKTQLNVVGYYKNYRKI